ncbi:hypothetical protein Lfu02_56290 [Longispora fulva]|uniref:Ig-like domain-containing protein n=1 Tax=Longispora fulva TaxID=619741 RepID=A0A8J7KJY0_9ACTN|nr:hypothetical protein [Longispora fulva]MBG6137389.1 hypothetical protein [Longispora fulva]GIG61257.1 hypothetical protein Lfu02_56290 [Longispora fulva]
MTDEPTVVSGLRLAGPSRRSRFGTWWSATTHAGATRGALLLDPALSQGPALDHVVAQVVAVRGLAVPGVLPVVDVLSEYGKVWMVTAEPATPTVAELLASDSAHDGDDAIAVALWTGQTLLSLHSGGLAHGDFGAHSVVLAASGAAALIEVALAPGDPAADVRAWAALLRVLAGRWGDPGLTRAAAVTDASGLAAGLEELARIDPGPALTGPALAEPTVVLRPGTSPAELTVRIAPGATPGEPERTVRLAVGGPGPGPSSGTGPVPAAGQVEQTRQFLPDQTVGLGSTARIVPPPPQPPGGGPTMTLGAAPTVRVEGPQVPPVGVPAGSVPPAGPAAPAGQVPAPGPAVPPVVGSASAPGAAPDPGRRPNAAEAARAIDELTTRTDESTVIRPGPVPVAQPGASLGEVTRPAGDHLGAPTAFPTQPGHATQPGQATQPGTATGFPTQVGTRAAPTVPPTGGGSDVRLRFGGGIPAGVEEAWKTGPPVPPKPGKKPVKRWRRIVGGLVTGAIIGGVVGYFWWYNAHPLKVTAAAVAPASPPGNGCDVTVDVVGTVTTNGRPGTITYQWLRSDGEATQELSQSVSSGTRSVPLHLHWKFSGKGEYQAKATLKVLGPTPTEAAGEFTYSCR